MKKIRCLLVVHDDLHTQHPEWIEPNGQSPICDEYERSLAESAATVCARFGVTWARALPTGRPLEIYLE